MIILTLLSSFFLTYILYKKSFLQSINQIYYIFCPLVFLFLASSLIELNFSRSLVYILFLPVFSFLGYMYFNKGGSKYVIVTFIVAILINFYVQPNFFLYYHYSKSNEKVSEKKFPTIQFEDSNLIDYEIPKDKIVVLDFWTTSCSLCFKKFPAMNTLYDKFRNNNKVLIIAVNVPLKNETRQERIRTYDSLGLDMSSIYSLSKEEVENKLNFNTYPHAIILKNNEILYQGFFEPLNNSLTFNYFTIEQKINELLNQ